MRKHLFFIFFVLISLAASAQDKYQDVVYLKNGSVIRGVVLEETPGEKIQIKTADGNIFVYRMDEVDQITKETAPEKSFPALNKNASNGLTKDYKGLFEFGYLFGVDGYAFDRISLDYVGGYQFSPNFFLGAGTGARFYIDAKTWALPLHADLRVNFLNKPVSPYLGLNVGYAWDITDSFEDIGLLFELSLGVSARLSNSQLLRFGVNYEIQNFSDGYRTSSTGAIGVKIGFFL